MKIKITYNLDTVMQERNLSYQQLSNMSGVSKTMLNNIVNGKRGMSVMVLCKLAEALKLSPEQLYTYERL